MQTTSSAAEADIDDGTRQMSPFKRGIRSNSSAIHRLSAALRRSLRLPNRSTPPQRNPPLNIDEQERQPKVCFTENSSTFIGQSLFPPRLDEIKENRRLNRYEKVKKIVRKADWPVRHEVRKELWRELCRSKDYDSSKVVFREQLSDVVGSTSKKAHNPQFLNEEGVVINNFDLNEHGTMKLLRLLKVIENMRPEISSAPMLYPLCALMLHYLDDADVFACIRQLLDSKGFLMTSPVEWAASSHMLLALIKKHKPTAYATLKRRVGTQDDVVLVKTMRDWLTWIFNGLPLSHVIRVVDCYLVEGNKFIIRAAIAIVYIWSKGQKGEWRADNLSAKSLDERVDAVKAELHGAAQQMLISTETFIETCVRIRNLQSATIARLQSHYEDRFRDEVTSQQTKKKANRGYANRPYLAPAFQSKIVDSETAAEIMTYLPARLQLATPQLLFRVSQDGASFTHLWNKVDPAEQSLLLIRTLKGEIFGAYCSSSWAERNDRRERSKSKYFGTGESFVWRLDEDIIGQYGWVGNNNENPDSSPQMFMAASDRLLVIGSGEGDAIRIDEELTRGMSSACLTFNSPALVPGRSFEIDELEVFDVMTGT